jgi:hypothetical protein
MLSVHLLNIKTWSEHECVADETKFTSFLSLLLAEEALPTTLIV